MLHWIDCDIVYLCSYSSSSCCIGLIAILFTCVFMVLPHVALDWLWYRFFCVFMVLRHVAFDLLWHCLSLFSWFFLMLHWIDCGIVYLCSYGSYLCCNGLIVTLFICVLMGLLYVALNWLWHCLSVFSWFFLMSHWINCRIVYLSSHGSYSCCIGLIVTVFICVLMGLPHVALDWLKHCLSVFLWVFLMLHWIDCDSIYLCSYGSSSCCIGLIVTLFVCFLVGLPHVAFDWLRLCLSVLPWFFLMLPWIDCDIVYLCSYGSSSFYIGLNVTLFICVFMVLPHVALEWLWHCLSVFLWFSFMLHWIDCDIVILCFHGSSSSCSIVLIVTVFICVLLFFPFFALDWLWHCLSVFICFFPHVALVW